MNTRVIYHYTDASNYKYSLEFIVRGSLVFADLVLFLDDSTGDCDGFCPVDVDLPHPGTQAENWPNEDDHCWCALDSDDFKPTCEPGTWTVDEVKDKFRKAFEAGWPGQNNTPEECN